MTLAHALSGEHVICYRLAAERGQIKLRLWEPTPQKDDVPTLPYLYAANFTFTSVAEAEKFLRSHLLGNGAFDVPDANFPAEGQIEILPYPTWGLEDS